MKLSQLVQSQSALNELLGLKLPLKIAYKISKLVNKVQSELDIFTQERNKLIKEMGHQTNVETDEWTVLPENLSKFQEELKKLGEIEVSLDFSPGKPLEKVKVEDLGDVAISSGDLVALDWLFE